LDSSGPIKAHRIELDERLPDEFRSLALRPDGSLLALGDRTGHVTLLDTVRLKVVGRIELPGEEAQRMFSALAFSPDGNSLAVGSPQGQILIWSLQRPSAPRLSLTLPGQRGVVSIVFDSQGQRLASSSMGLDPIVEIWDLDLIHRELARYGFGN
jgi:WD40 repeat protein